MKNQDLKKLNSSPVRVKNECAISMLKAKLQIVNAELSVKYGRNVVEEITGRIKSMDSIRAKLKKKGLEESYEAAIANVNDIVGVRAVCSFMDDVYAVADTLSCHKDIGIIKVKDYLKQPKNSGYRSLHLIVELPVYFQGDAIQVRAEVQLRTLAMDFWAGLDHQLRYKKGKKEAVMIGEELKMYSAVVADLDAKMMELRNRIAAI